MRILSELSRSRDEESPLSLLDLINRGTFDLELAALAILFSILVCVDTNAQMPSSWQIVEVKETKGPSPATSQIGVVVQTEDAKV